MHSKKLFKKSIIFTLYVISFILMIDILHYFLTSRWEYDFVDFVFTLFTSAVVFISFMCGRLSAFEELEKEEK